MTDTQDRNEHSVHSFYDAEQRRDIEAWATFWHQDGRQSFWLASKRAPVVGRDALVAETREKFATRPPYTTTVATERFADESRILARLHLTSSALPDLDVHIWCIFQFDDAGLVVEIEEMTDTAITKP